MKTLLYIAALLFLLAAAVFKFIFVGFGTLALTLFFGALCCGFFALLHKRPEKPFRILRITAMAILLVGFGCFMAAEFPVVSGSRSDPDTAADYVIVMGAGVNGLEPSLSLQNRLNTAYTWLLDHPDGIAILSGGKGRGEDITEAQCMFDWLVQKGIEPERLLLEDQASNTYENIQYSLALLQAQDLPIPTEIAIVSSDYHLCRIRMIAGYFGVDSLCQAAHTPYLSLYVNCAIREAFALWEIWVFGFGA